MRSLVKRIWPFSYFTRIERKIDHMSTQSEKMKAVLDTIAGHVSGLKSGIDSMQANLTAALKSAADNNQKSDPLLDAALSEATDLSDKLGAMEDALKPHVEVPVTESPAPAADPQPDAPATANEPGDANAPKPPPTRADLDKALAELPGSYTDPDFVVNGMRSFYGDLFTADDEAKVREVVKPKSDS